MLNKTVVFINGHFVDKETGKRIVLTNLSSYVLVGDELSLREEDPLNSPPRVYLSAKEMLNAVQNSPKIKTNNYFKIAEAGQRFVFRVGLGIRSGTGQNDKEFVFSAIINEDLYCYSNDKELKKWRLFNCKTTVDQCLSGNLNMYETIYAYSLNDAFSKTIAFYFPLNRKSSGNVQNEFYLWDGKKPVGLFNEYKKHNSQHNIKSIIEYKINKFNK